MKRAIDFFVGVILLLLLVIIMLFIAVAIRLISKGPSLYWSERIGKNNKYITRVACEQYNISVCYSNSDLHFCNIKKLYACFKGSTRCRRKCNRPILQFLPAKHCWYYYFCGFIVLDKINTTRSKGTYSS